MSLEQWPIDGCRHCIRSSSSPCPQRWRFERNRSVPVPVGTRSVVDDGMSISSLPAHLAIERALLSWLRFDAQLETWTRPLRLHQNGACQASRITSHARETACSVT